MNNMNPTIISENGFTPQAEEQSLVVPATKVMELPVGGSRLYTVNPNSISVSRPIGSVASEALDATSSDTSKPEGVGDSTTWNNVMDIALL